MNHQPSHVLERQYYSIIVRVLLHECTAGYQNVFSSLYQCMLALFPGLSLGMRLTYMHAWHNKVVYVT